MNNTATDRRNQLSEEEIETLQSQVLELETKILQLLNGWKEAANAWATCAAIHRDYAKGVDPLYRTRQADFIRDHANARSRALLGRSYL